MGRNLFLFEFERPFEADRVFCYGARRCGTMDLVLQWWCPSVGVLSPEEEAYAVWVRVFGVPLHTREIERL